MPAVDPTKANFDKGYTFNASAIWYGDNGLDAEGYAGEGKITLNYSRYWRIGTLHHTAQLLIDSLGITDGQSIGLIGAGFGWTAEKLAEVLPTSEIVSVDTSPWVQGAKGTTEESEIIAACVVAGITDPARQAVWVSRFGGNAPRSNVTVLDFDLTKAGDRVKLLKEIAGTTFDFSITEDVLPWLLDNEMQILSTEMHKVSSVVAHYVSEFNQEQADYKFPEVEPVYNWHTLLEYKAMMPNDIFIAAISKEVL